MPPWRRVTAGSVTRRLLIRKMNKLEHEESKQQRKQERDGDECARSAAARVPLVDVDARQVAPRVGVPLDARRSRPMSRSCGISTSRPRRRREPSPRNIHVAAAASPRAAPAEYPRRGRGVAASRLRYIRAANVRRPPRRRTGRDLFQDPGFDRGVVAGRSRWQRGPGWPLRVERAEPRGQLGGRHVRELRHGHAQAAPDEIPQSNFLISDAGADERRTPSAERRLCRTDTAVTHKKRSLGQEPRVRHFVGEAQNVRQVRDGVPERLVLQPPRT